MFLVGVASEHGKIPEIISINYQCSELSFSFNFKVKDLAATLEHSLSFGTPARKPAGGVALLHSGSQQQQPQAAKRPVVQQVECCLNCIPFP